MLQLSKKDFKINTNQFAVKLKKYLLAKSHAVSAIQKKYLRNTIKNKMLCQKIIDSISNQKC